MLGFLVYDVRSLAENTVAAACKELRTFEAAGSESIGHNRVQFFQNASRNSYRISDDRLLLSATGTLIFNDCMGMASLELLRQELLRGKALSDVFSKLRGPFTLLHINRQSKAISILNAREGLRHCYRTECVGHAAFSTNLLLLAGLTGAVANPDGLREFIHFGAPLNEKTIFDGISRIPGAMLHEHHGEAWKKSRLWRLAPQRPQRISLSQAVEETTKRFSKQLEFASTLAPGEVAADLTAGTDSRLNLACVLEKQPSAVVTTSGPKDLVDAKVALQIAKKVGLEHYWYFNTEARISETSLNNAIDICDGSMLPFHFEKEMPYYQEKSERFGLMTGGGGGPLFKDHYWLFEFNRVGKNREPNWHRIARFSIASHAIRDNYLEGFQDGMLDNLANMFLQRSQEVTGTNNQKLDFVYFDLKCPSFDGNAFSLTSNFLDVYHAMLDADLVQYSINLPPEIRVRNNLQFGITHNLRPDISWILTDNGVPSIPPVGLNSWLRLLRGKRYIATIYRKIRTAALGFSGENVSKVKVPSTVVQLKKLGYFDLLDHSSLSFASMVSCDVLEEFRANPEGTPNSHYLTSTLAAELYFQRAKKIGQQSRQATA